MTVFRGKTQAGEIRFTAVNPRGDRLEQDASGQETASQVPAEAATALRLALATARATRTR